MEALIPKDPAWCSFCRCPEHFQDGSPCSDHRGPDGKPIEYEGTNAYVPSSWVLDVVGGKYRAPRWDGKDNPVIEYVCDGYDPRSGFWMRDPNDGYQTNVSEAAIGRTYHLVRT